MYIPRSGRAAVLAHLFLLAFLGLATATAHAQTVLRITGAQAFRGVTHTAIGHILGTGYTFAYQGTNLSTASAAIFTGTVGGTQVVIKTAWTGSTAGIRSLALGQPVGFLPDNTPQSVGGTSNAGAATEQSIPDVAATDSYQNATIYTAPALRDVVVGVAPYVFVVNNGAPAALTNMTSQIAPALWQNGSVPLALFTGSAADAGTTVYAIGRDPESGARLIAFAEAGIKIFAQVVQYQATISGSAVTGQSPWPAETIGGVAYPQGSSGYGSFSTLGNVLTKTTQPALNGYYVSYLPVPDALNAVAGGARILAYNGVPYTLANVQSGNYSLWGYEHLMSRSTLADDKRNIADTLANQLTVADATVLLSGMHVTRLGDGTVVLPLQ